MNKFAQKLTSHKDWEVYHSMNKLEQDSPSHLHVILNNEILPLKPGNLFEIGCGNSHFIMLCAKLGWNVSGIDFQLKSIDNLMMKLQEPRYKVGKIIHADALTYDLESIHGTFDVLASFGFFEHFANPDILLKKWIYLLKSGGKVITAIPNLQSINALILSIYNKSLWNKHKSITPGELDHMHESIGLSVYSPAKYCGRFELDMLIPWESVSSYYPYLMTKLLRYLGSFLITPIFRLLSPLYPKYLCPIIYGSYLINDNNSK